MHFLIIFSSNKIIMATVSFLLFLFPFFLSLLDMQVVGEVTINPSVPLYLPINGQETVTCHIASGTIRNWYIILQNGIEKGINPLIAISNAQFPGITGRYVPEGYSTLLITINMTNTSIAGLRCEGVNAEGLIFSATINLTIYGDPISPFQLYLFEQGNFILTTWKFHTVPTISIMFTITLTFLSPSQLKDITKYVTDTDSYNFTLEGVRSCDPFTMCITATNIVGQSPPSCVNKTLPYIPSTNDIEYSLTRVGDSYSLNLTIQMSRICKIQEGNLLSIEVKKDNILLFSDVFLAIHSDTYLIEGLIKNSVYRLVVISNTSVGWKSSEVLLINTCCNTCINICQYKNLYRYNVSCKFDSDCAISMCRYILIGNSIMDFEGSLTPGGYNMISSINITSYNYIRISDGSINNRVRHGQLYNLSEYYTNECKPSTQETEELMVCDSRFALSSSFAIVEAVVIIVLSVVLVTMLYISRKGLLCDKYGRTSRTKTTIMDNQISLEHAINSSSEIVKRKSLSCNEDVLFDVNPSYDTVSAQRVTRSSALENKTPCYETIPINIEH